MNCLLNQCYIAQTVHLRLCKIFKIALSTFIRALTISGFANNANRSGVHTSPEDLVSSSQLVYTWVYVS